MSNNHNHNHCRRSSLIDQHHYNHPSFSSLLLEEIYRSFDEDDEPSHFSSSSHRKLKMMNKSNSCFLEREIFQQNDRFRVNPFVLDQWMENNQKLNLRRNSMNANNYKSVSKFNSFSSSSSSSSDSSSGIGGFSSSDTESFYNSSKSKSKILTTTTLKPIRTNLNPPEFHRQSYSDEIPSKKKGNSGNKEGNLQKRALKLYGDLKKVKQPISPGGKLASFLNSLFNSNASKKPKISSSSSLSSSGQKFSTSTPTTASSYSRSCLSKTPSSAGKFERRSVRFCPMNTVIAVASADNVERGEEWREKASKNSCSNVNEELKVQIKEKHRRVEGVAKKLLKNYNHGRKYQNDVNNIIINKNNNNIRPFEVEEEEDEDDVSCCSSDLFELENLLEIGVERRYREELPVYETTHVDTNRAIAKGFLL